MKFNPLLPLATMPFMLAQAQDKPNVIMLYIDDMGFSDPSCFGGTYTETSNIDRIADEGLRFHQYYAACPISSPSRTGLTTGMFPTRWGINTFLQDRASNAREQQNNYLDNRAPSMARAFQHAGYHTGHFGKWHMGGGRDVKDAPSIATYGFDEFNSTWESPNPDPKLTSSNWIWAPSDEVKRWDRTAYFVDKTLDFLSRHKGEPCFVNLWPDDVHTPWVYDGDEASMRESAASFTIVLKELDRQIGRLLDGLDELGIADNTILIFTSDNGPAPAFDGHRTHQFRGQKGTLYEGGVRMPFIIRWPGKIAPGRLNEETTICAVDLYPSLCAIAGIDTYNDYPLDGVDMSQQLLGKSTADRPQPIFWEFGKNKADRVSPHIGVREGEWKLMVNADGSRCELYNMRTDYLEKNNLASARTDIVERLKPMAINWFKNSFRQYADNVLHVAVDGDEAADGSSWAAATTVQHAIQLASGAPNTQLWMKQGTYLIDASLNADNVGFYGGFDGTEELIGQRDWSKNPTILDGQGKVSPIRNMNLDQSTSTVIDGVIIQNGFNQTGCNGNGNGGGALLTNGTVIRNCVFRNNRTQNGKNGAALHCQAGAVKVYSSLFVNNESSGNGGAVQVGGGVTATLVNCTLVNNKAVKGGGAIGTGTATDSHLNFINSIAWNNEGKGIRNSYSQNDNVNAGGNIKGINSAIETTSTKFADGDDVGLIILNEETTPGFVNPTATIGAAELSDYSYELADGSLCVDAGNATYAVDVDYDLLHNPRLSGTQIDMGAYEADRGAYDEGSNIVYVSPEGDANANGSSWENATDIEHGIAIAGTKIGDVQLWLKGGTYLLEKTVFVDDIVMFGGFNGTEKELGVRDWYANPTILDGQGKISPVRNSNLEKACSTVIDGVIIQNGFNQTGCNGNGNGGGALLTNGAVVRNCIFRNNRTQNGKNGAALHCQVGAVRVENSLFVNNESTGNGGAVQVGGGVNATLLNCTLVNNKAVKPGGAVGTGNNGSNLELINSIAWNNEGNGQRNSYGQNDNMNGGGTIKAINSAVESASTKFADGDDVGLIVLSETVTPGFVNPGATIGLSADAADFSYQLSTTSSCIDAGGNDFSTGLAYDLNHQQRVVGDNIDLGAYEMQDGTAVEVINARPLSEKIILRDGAVYVYAANDADLLSIYSSMGTLLHQQRLVAGSNKLNWHAAPNTLNILKVGEQSQKIMCEK